MQVEGLRRLEDPLPQPPYLPLVRPPVDLVPLSGRVLPAGLVLRSVRSPGRPHLSHRRGDPGAAIPYRGGEAVARHRVQLALRSQRSWPLGFNGSPALHELARHLAFITPDPPQWLADRLDDLDEGNIEAIIDAAHRYQLEGVLAGELDKKLGYFVNNAHRMRYARFKSPGMFTGSGAIEAGCKAIVTQRAKQSGMRWTVNAAAGIISLRCQHASGRWDELCTATPAQRGSGQPSDRHHDSDTQARPGTKIISYKYVVPPPVAAAAQ